MKGIPALTVRQPWAWAIVAGHKDIENRSWATKYRGTLYIHAASQLADETSLRQFEALCQRVGIPCPDYASLPLTAIIGSVRVVDCLDTHESPWAEGPKCWVLTNAESIKPRIMRGSLGLWFPQSRPRK